MIDVVFCKGILEKSQSREAFGLGGHEVGEILGGARIGMRPQDGQLGAGDA